VASDALKNHKGLLGDISFTPRKSFGIVQRTSCWYRGIRTGSAAMGCIARPAPPASEGNVSEQALVCS